MAAELIMAQVNNANQTAQALAGAGKTFTVGKVTAAGGGMRNMITLTPTGNASGTVAVKLDGARQMGDLAALSGKTVTVAKPAIIGGGNNMLAIKPVAASVTKASAASSVSIVKLEGARQGMQAAALTGQKFTVVKPVIVGNNAASTLFLQPTGGGNLVALKMANAAPTTGGLVGKTVVVGKAPLVAGKTGTTLMALKPVVAATTAAKGAVGAAAAAAATTATASPATTGSVQMKSIAMTTKVAVPAKAATGAAAVKSTVASGTIWNGTGVSLGLGLGLGIWGPVIAAGVGAAAVYGCVRKRKEALQVQEV